MTSHGFYLLFIRRWYVFLLGFGIVLVAMASYTAPPRIYSTTTEVAFNTPRERPPHWTDEDKTETLVDFTGAVMHRYAAAYPTLVLSSPGASLIGNGIREGTSVELSSFGSQWRISFNRPSVTVRISSSNLETVLESLDEVTSRLSRISQDLQSETGIPERYSISVSVDRANLVVNSFGQTRNGKFKGTAALVLVVLVLSTLASIVLEHVLPRNTGVDVPSRAANASSAKRPLNRRGVRIP